MELPTGQMYGPCMELTIELDFDGDVNDMKADYSVDY